jgi:hypothetical protein
VGEEVGGRRTFLLCGLEEQEESTAWMQRLVVNLARGAEDTTLGKEKKEASDEASETMAEREGGTNSKIRKSMARSQLRSGSKESEEKESKLRERSSTELCCLLGEIVFVTRSSQILMIPTKDPSSRD